MYQRTTTASRRHVRMLTRVKVERKLHNDESAEYVMAQAGVL